MPPPSCNRRPPLLIPSLHSFRAQPVPPRRKYRRHLPVNRITRPSRTPGLRSSPPLVQQAQGQELPQVLYVPLAQQEPEQEQE